MIPLVFEGIPIPPEYRTSSELMWAYIEGYKAGQKRPTKRAKLLFVDEAPPVSHRGSVAEQVRLARKYKMSVGPAGTYPPPKRPWEMTADELKHEQETDSRLNWELALGYSSKLPIAFGPPPVRPKGGVYSFDEEPIEPDTLAHMRRIRRKIRPFIPLSAFGRES